MTPSVTLDVILQKLSHVQQCEQRENAKVSWADHFYHSFSSVQAVSHNIQYSYTGISKTLLRIKLM